MKTKADVKKILIEPHVQFIADFLIEKKESISVAESVTAGLMQLKLASAENASEFFQGGMTAYNIGQKYRHLKIDPIHAATVNCVSQQIAEQMSLSVCEMFSSQWGIGITGYATPVPQGGFKLFAFYSISYKNRIVSKGKISAAEEKPDIIQALYVSSVFEKLRLCMKQH